MDNPTASSILSATPPCKSLGRVVDIFNARCVFYPFTRGLNVPFKFGQLHSLLEPRFRNCNLLCTAGSAKIQLGSIQDSILDWIAKNRLDRSRKSLLLLFLLILRFYYNNDT